jgi:hypothetical protein
MSVGEDSLELTPEFLENLVWDPVTSSNVLRLAWFRTAGPVDDHESTGDFYVDFGVAGAPKVYRYAGVSFARYKSVLHAASVGGMVNKVIKGNYAADRVEIVPAEAKVLDVEDVWTALQDVGAALASIESRLANIERGLASLHRTESDQEENHG